MNALTPTERLARRGAALTRWQPDKTRRPAVEAARASLRVTIYFSDMTSFPNLLTWIGALSSWPVDWARGLLQLQASAKRRALRHGGLPPPGAGERLAESAATWQSSAVGAGFDLARSHYAAAVQAGVIPRSLLACGALERRLARLERLALGPRARSV